MLTSERLFIVSTATTILALASVVVRVVVVARLLHTFVADAYNVNGLVDYTAFDRSSIYSTFWL